MAHQWRNTCSQENLLKGFPLSGTKGRLCFQIFFACIIDTVTVLLPKRSWFMTMTMFYTVWCTYMIIYVTWVCWFKGWCALLGNVSPLSASINSERRLSAFSGERKDFHVHTVVMRPVGRWDGCLGGWRRPSSVGFCQCLKKKPSVRTGLSTGRGTRSYLGDPLRVSATGRAAARCCMWRIFRLWE